MPQRLRAIRWESALFLLLIAFLGLLVVPPTLSVVFRSFVTTTITGLAGAPTLANYATFFAQSDLLRLLANTSLFALGTTVFASAVGGMLAWIVMRTNAPWRNLGYASVLLSLAIPYVLYTVAWLLLLGPRGPLNAALMSVFRLAEPPIDPNSLWAMSLVEGLVWSPLAFLLLASVLSTVDASMEEVAQVSGARGWPVMRDITLPLVAPAIAGVVVLVFVRAAESFEIPALIGLPGRVLVLTTRIYQGTKGFPPDYGGVSAYGTLLVAAILAIVFWSRRALGDPRKFEVITGKAYRPRPVDLGRWRFVATGVLVGYLGLLLLVPFAMILWASFLPFYVAPGADALPLLTVRNYETIARGGTFAEAIVNTVVVGLTSASAIVVLTTLAAWIVVKSRVRGRALLDQLATLPLVLPGIVLGLAVLTLYLQVPLVYGTLAILVVAYSARYLPYGMSYGIAAMHQIGHELEEASMMSGASTWQTLRRIVFPIVAPAALSAWLLIFLLTGKELSIAVLLSGPRTPVMSVMLFDLWSNGQITEVAALGVVWTLVLGTLAAVLQLLGRRYGVRIQP